MDTNYISRLNYFLEALPLATPFGWAPIFLGAGLLVAGFLAAGFLAAGFLAGDARLVADFFAAEAFLAGALTLPAFLTTFLDPTWSNRYDPLRKRY